LTSLHGELLDAYQHNETVEGKARCQQQFDFIQDLLDNALQPSPGASVVHCRYRSRIIQPRGPYRVLPCPVSTMDDACSIFCITVEHGLAHGQLQVLFSLYASGQVEIYLPDLSSNYGPLWCDHTIMAELDDSFATQDAADENMLYLVETVDLAETSAFSCQVDRFAKAGIIGDPAAPGTVYVWHVFGVQAISVCKLARSLLEALIDKDSCGVEASLRARIIESTVRCFYLS
jgi:hypothetical protein